MKTGVVILGVLFGLLFHAGCSSVIRDNSEIHRVHLLPLTSFVSASGRRGDVELKAVIELLDAKDIPGKYSSIIRFELYEFVPLSSDHRGNRLTLWPDITLNQDSNQNQYWKPYLNGYELLLLLSFKPKSNSKYVLEVTCMLERYRYTDQKIIEYP